MNQDRNHDIRDLTKHVTVVFDSGSGRVERRFVIREHSRSEQDHYVELQERASQRTVEMAGETAQAKKSAVETLQAALALSWVSLAPVVAYVLREPADDMPAPSVEEIEQGLNRRKAMAILDIQNDLDGINEIKKNLDKMNKRLAKLQLSQEQTGVSGTPLTIASLDDMD